jgi:hypothetical protein
VTGHLVLLTTLNNESASKPSVNFGVFGAAPLGRAIHDNIRHLDEICERSRHQKSCGNHRLPCLIARRKQGQAAMGRLRNAPVGRDIGDTDQCHIALQAHTRRDAPADDAIANDRHFDRIFVNHHTTFRMPHRET